MVFYIFKIFPSHSHASMLFTFKKAIPLGNGDFFLPPLQGSSIPWFSLTSVTCFMALCYGLYKAVVPAHMLEIPVWLSILT